MSPDHVAVAQFWQRAHRATHLGNAQVLPQAWAFGATKHHADELLALVLAGIKRATASALWDYAAEGEEVPQVGELSIILDGDGAPRALIETTHIDLFPFNEVPADHAYLEGEGDRTLGAWREIHERYWRQYSLNSRGFTPDMPVVCERFEVRYHE